MRDPSSELWPEGRWGRLGASRVSPRPTATLSGEPGLLDWSLPSPFGRQASRPARPARAARCGRTKPTCVSSARCRRPVLRASP
eukprot:1850606-Alexandrium_andersonii.AAC.1